MTKKTNSRSPEAPTGSVVSFLDKMSPDVAELLLDLRDIAAECVGRAVMLLALFRRENRICSQIRLVKPMMGL